MVKNPVLKEVLDWALHIGIAVIIGLLIVTFVAQMTVVKGPSMLPTLQENNRLLIEKISPKIGALHRGDIITLYVPEMLEGGKETIIKRVIGLENDKIEIKDGKVYVNDKPLQEDYINGNETGDMGGNYSSVTVKKGQVYVMGDNRGNSLDSRIKGPIDLKKVTGKVLVRVYPFNEIGRVR